MLRDAAVARINRGLGFLPVGHGQTNDIIDCLQEAQRDLEKGKTLPKFLLLEDQELTLLTGENTVDLPEDFLRVDDDNGIYYIGPDSHLRRYLVQFKYYRDAVESIQSQQRPDQPVVSTDAPWAYIIRGSTIDFITSADTDYDLVWNYYRKDELLTSNIENLWLTHASEWLIGEAGLRMAMDKRDKGAVELFTAMMQKGRMAVFAEDLAAEDAAGPIVMGANL